MTEPEKPLPSLDELKREISEANPKGGEDQQAESARVNYGKAMRLGTDLLAGVGVGGVIGYFIDQAAGTSPIFFIVFFFIGFAAGVRNIIRSAGNI